MLIKSSLRPFTLASMAVSVLLTGCAPENEAAPEQSASMEVDTAGGAGAEAAMDTIPFGPDTLIVARDPVPGDLVCTLHGKGGHQDKDVPSGGLEILLTGPTVARRASVVYPATSMEMLRRVSEVPGAQPHIAAHNPGGVTVTLTKTTDCMSPSGKRTVLLQRVKGKWDLVPGFTGKPAPPSLGLQPGDSIFEGVIPEGEDAAPGVREGTSRFALGTG